MELNFLSLICLTFSLTPLEIYIKKCHRRAQNEVNGIPSYLWSHPLSFSFFRFLSSIITATTWMIPASTLFHHNKQAATNKYLTLEDGRNHVSRSRTFWLFLSERKAILLSSSDTELGFLPHTTPPKKHTETTPAWITLHARTAKDKLLQLE